MSSSWETTYAAETTRHSRPAGANGSAPPWFSYGTAGFRTDATLLRSTCFRAGAFAAARAIAHGGKTTGMVVTASHNPGRDNGVKLVEPDGGTLPMALERAAEALANAGDDDAAAQIEALREALDGLAALAQAAFACLDAASAVTESSTQMTEAKECFKECE